MIPKDYYETVLKEYPEYISLEQMYRICHHSKRTCRYLLESGLVPNHDNGKKTRRFTIKTADVIKYLYDREENQLINKTNPIAYRNQRTTQNSNLSNRIGRPLTTDDYIIIRTFFEHCLDSSPDVLTVANVSLVTGYCKSSVVNWCYKKILNSYLIKRKYYIPKEYLLDFMCGRHFLDIAVKSTLHIKYNNRIMELLESSNSHENA